MGRSVSYKARSEEEIEAMLRDYANGLTLAEIEVKYKISHSGFYRLLAMSKGYEPKPNKKTQESRIKKLEKQLAEREREIALLKDILKKS